MAFSLALILQIFALLNPLSSFPVLIAAYKKKMDVRRIAFSASVVAYLLAVAIIFFGPLLFSIYGISVNSFRIAGGVALFLLGLDTIRPKLSVHDVGEMDSLISLIATPLLTGPATISFLTIQAIEIGQLDLLLTASAAFVLVGVIFVLFSLSIPKLNPKVVEISSKVFGLFLMAMAVEMMGKGAAAMLWVKPV